MHFFVQVNWKDIAGLDHLIQELRETVILPIQKRELFADSRLTQPPKGVLLHGPPGKKLNTLSSVFSTIMYFWVRLPNFFVTSFLGHILCSAFRRLVELCKCNCHRVLSGSIPELLCYFFLGQALCSAFGKWLSCSMELSFKRFRVPSPKFLVADCKMLEYRTLPVDFVGIVSFLITG